MDNYVTIREMLYSQLSYIRSSANQATGWSAFGNAQKVPSVLRTNILLFPHHPPWVIHQFLLPHTPSQLNFKFERLTGNPKLGVVTGSSLEILEDVTTNWYFFHLVSI